MTSDVRRKPLSGPIVGQREWTPDAARPRPNIAAVVEYRDGSMQVLWPDEPAARLPLLRRPVRIHEVDIFPHRSTFSAVLPAKAQGRFQAKIILEWQVVDPVAVVHGNVTSVRAMVAPELSRQARRISALFAANEIIAAEEELNRQLSAVEWPGWRRDSELPIDSAYIGAEYGLWARAFVRLTRPAVSMQSRPMVRGKDTQEDRKPGSEEYRERAQEQLAVPGRDDSYRPLLDAVHFHEDIDDLLFTLRVKRLERMANLAVNPEISDETKAELLRELRELQKRDWWDQAPKASLSATYDEVVQSALAELVEPGRLLFNPPDHMQLGDTARVEVRLTRTLLLDDELVKGLVGLGAPQVEEIPTAPLMAVTLRGEGFKITAYSDEEQLVTKDQITTWEFDIKALKRGRQRLVISASLRIPIPGQAVEHKSVPVREAVVEVQIGPAAAAAQWISRNWKWAVATAIGIAGIVTGLIFH